MSINQHRISTDSPTLVDKRQSINKLLSPLKTYFSVKDGYEFIEQIKHSRKTLDQLSENFNKNEIEILAKAFSQNTMPPTLWGKIELWKAFMKYLSITHLDTGKLLYLRKTDPQLRHSMVSDLIKNTKSLLWLNLGGVNHIYKDSKGVELSKILKKTLNKFEPNLFVTVGPSRTISSKGCSVEEANVERLQQNLFFKTIFDYIKKINNKNKAQVINLKSRMENHFGLSLGESGLPTLRMLCEILHNEDQLYRTMFRPKDESALKLQIGLVLNHLLNSKNTEWLQQLTE